MLLPALAAAHEPTALELEPDEIVPVVCDFRSEGAVPSGTTCDTEGTPVVTVRAGTDGTPAGLISSGPTASGANMNLTIAPGASREGNKYQVHACCAFSNGATLCCNFPVHVKKVTVR